MGGFEGFLLGKLEPSLRDHSGKARILMVIYLSRHLTVSGGQFVWGESRLKSNDGVLRSPQVGRQSTVECIGIRWLNCDFDRRNRYESRAK